jgi:hypothetical protein
MFDKETKIVFVSRPTFSATFDNAPLTLKLEAGRDGKNAVLTKWFDPIKEHDEIVKDVEEKQAVAKALARVYAAAARTVKNWDAAWLIMNERPEELEEYLTLKKKHGFKGDLATDKEIFIKYFDDLKDPKVKVESEVEWKRFVTLNAKSERLLTMQNAVMETRDMKDQAFKNSQQADVEYDKSKETEKEGAARISSDHVVADEQRVGIAELFPTIQNGFIVTAVNGNECEDLPFADIQTLIFENFPPHTLQMRRYDYRRDMAKGNWYSLQELRDQNKYVEDPRLVRSFFTDMCRKGNNAEIGLALRRGADINSYDSTTGQTGLHAAACGCKIETMEILINEGAEIDVRDRNMETPLLLATRTGCIKSTIFLLKKGASAKLSDRMGRNILMHAIKSENLELVETMMNYAPDMHSVDKEWGWTPLHFAAATGSVEMTALVIDGGGDVYSVSKKGHCTCLDVAEQNQHERVSHFVREYIFHEPAQNITPDAKIAIWLGKKDAAYPIFATNRQFGGILSIFEHGNRAWKTSWLFDEQDEIHNFVVTMKKNENGKYKLIPNQTLAEMEEEFAREHAHRDDAQAPEHAKPEAAVVSTDGESREEKKKEREGEHDWEALLLFLKDAMTFCDKCLASNRTLLIHDDEGSNFATAFLIVYLCTRKRIRVADAAAHVVKIRREAKVSEGMALGLKGFQESLDTMKLRRLEKRLKDSDVVSVGF